MGATPPPPPSLSQISMNASLHPVLLELHALMKLTATAASVRLVVVAQDAKKVFQAAYSICFQIQFIYMLATVIRAYIVKEWKSSCTQLDFMKWKGIGKCGRAGLE